MTGKQMSVILKDKIASKGGSTRFFSKQLPRQWVAAMPLGQIAAKF